MPAVITDEDSNYLIQNINLARKIEKLPPMVYTPVLTEEGPRLIKGRSTFDIPKELLGDHTTIRDLIVSDYFSTKAPVGVILVGLKGSGKTMLSEDLCNLVLQSGRPVLNVTSPIPGGILSMMIDVVGPCAVLFDEFGKVYDETKLRNTVLTLFSDSEKRNILFIVTANTQHEFTDAMIDRPGRFKYRINYDGIKEAVAVQALHQKAHTPELTEYLRIYCTYHAVSFDMLLLMKKLLKHCKTPADFIKEIEFYNLPNKINIRYTVPEVTYGGSTTDHRAFIDEQPDGSLILEVTEAATGNVVHSEKFVWTDTTKVKRGKIWHMTITDNFKIGVEREVTQHKFREKARPVGKKGLADMHSFRHPDEEIEYNEGHQRYQDPVKSF